jgi:nitroimidazol reductase NimA-like FMN-containing flavoprotein (pyridoxamine 5'-phosphate oxidase superfamily)
MTDYTDSVVRKLTEDECRARLAGEQLGRLALRVGDRVDIFPINFAYSHGDIYFRTAPGDKLLELTITTEVVFEIDKFTDVDAWSVIARGVAERLEHDAQIDEAWQLPLRPWIPTVKLNWVRVHVTQLSGRHFRREPEPEPPYEEG